MKIVRGRRYVHRSALAQLSARDLARVEALARLVPDFEWSVARVGKDGVMLGLTTSFGRNDHPELIASITRKAARSRPTVRRYAPGMGPIYHRCELMLESDHPRAAHFARLTAREAAAGKLSRPDIGTARAWKRASAANRPRQNGRRATGDCYQAAGKYVLAHPDDKILLVHGEVAGRGRLSGKTFGHAWVLDGDTVIDQSNGRNLRIPKAVYYAIGQVGEIGNVYTYTPERALVNVLRHKHWGPWDLKTRSGL